MQLLWLVTVWRDSNKLNFISHQFQLCDIICKQTNHCIEGKVLVVVDNAHVCEM